MKNSNFEKVLLAFLGGAAIGVAVGMLYAPDKGSETRKKIARKAKNFSANMDEQIAELKERAESLMEEINNIAQIFTLPSEKEEEA